MISRKYIYDYYYFTCYKLIFRSYPEIVIRASIKIIPKKSIYLLNLPKMKP